MDFGAAIAALHEGKRVTRPSWNGKDMWLVLVTPGNYDVGCATLGYKPGVNEPPTLAPWVGMKTAQNVFTPWHPAQSDQLGKDWMIYEETVQEVSCTSIVRIPLRQNDTKCLFGLINNSGVALDLTDSIDTVTGVRVVDPNGSVINHKFSEPRKGEQRKLIIQGELPFSGHVFQVIVDTDTTNSRVLTDLPGDWSTEMFVELEVKRINHNRRPV